jgi:hypothetical protein
MHCTCGSVRALCDGREPAPHVLSPSEPGPRRREAERRVAQIVQAPSADADHHAALVAMEPAKRLPNHLAVPRVAAVRRTPRQKDELPPLPVARTLGGTTRRPSCHAPALHLSTRASCLLCRDLECSRHHHILQWVKARPLPAATRRRERVRSAASRASPLANRRPRVTCRGAVVSHCIVGMCHSVEERVFICTARGRIETRTPQLCAHPHAHPMHEAKVRDDDRGAHRRVDVAPAQVLCAEEDVVASARAVPEGVAARTHTHL